MLKTTVASAALCVSAALALPAAAEISNSPETLAIGAFRDNQTFDRSMLRTSHWATYWQPVFDTLLRVDSEGEIHPNVAESYELAEDGQTLTLTLREGLTFTDGSPVDAEAAKANIEFLLNSNGQNRWGIEGISSIDTPSATELVIHLSEPNPAILYSLGTVGGVLAAPATLGTEEAKAIPVGSGPYIYDQDASVQGRQYVYRRNPDYWNPEAFPFENVSITPMADLSARLNALRSGQIDAAPGDPRAAAEAEASRLDVSNRSIDMFSIFIADRAGEMVPALGDVRVRQAINMAVDAPSILEFVDKGFGTLSDQPNVAPNRLHVDDLKDRYPYDPDAARALIEEAGYGDGITIQMPELASMTSYNPILAQQLQEIGITVEWQKVSPATTISDLLSGKYPMFLFRLGSETAWGDVQKFIAPDAAWNTRKSETEELTALIEAAQYAPLDDDAPFHAITEYLVDNAWFAPWYSYDSVYMTNSDVEVTMPSLNVVPWLWDYRPQQ